MAHIECLDNRYGAYVCTPNTPWMRQWERKRMSSFMDVMKKARCEWILVWKDYLSGTLNWIRIGKGYKSDRKCLGKNLDLPTSAAFLQTASICASILGWRSRRCLKIHPWYMFLGENKAINIRLLLWHCKNILLTSVTHCSWFLSLMSQEWGSLAKLLPSVLLECLSSFQVYILFLMK